MTAGGRGGGERGAAFCPAPWGHKYPAFLRTALRPKEPGDWPRSEVCAGALSPASRRVEGPRPGGSAGTLG